MSVRLGTIKGKRIAKNRDGDANVRLLDSEISSPEDVQSVELITGSGEDYSPEDEDVVLVISLGTAYKMGILVDDQVDPDETLEDGEKELYSKKSGAKLATIRLNKDSEVILNGGVDFAVAFTELKAQIDQLRADLIAHVHPGVTPGGASTGVSATAFSVNVDNTKVEKVRL